MAGYKGIAMAWYYAKDGERFGPYTDAQFEGLVAQGTVTADTLVWRDGMDNWLPYGRVSGGAPAQYPSAAPMGDADIPMTVCSSCGRTFPSDEVIQYQGHYICAECKPVFVQQIKEGGLLTGEMLYAGFWIRVGAAIIDGVILFVPSVILNFLYGFLGSAFESDDFSPIAALLIAMLYIIQIAIPMSYETFFLGRYGQTPGKMVCGIKVVRADGTPITYLRAFGRYWAKRLSYLVCFVGVIIVGFDEEKRALHDHICDTRAIRL